MKATVYRAARGLKGTLHVLGAGPGGARLTGGRVMSRWPPPVTQKSPVSHRAPPEPEGEETWARTLDCALLAAAKDPETAQIDVFQQESG